MKIVYLLGALLAAASLNSCGVTTLAKSDSRFAPILGKEVHVKEPIFLYEISPELNGDSSRFPIRSAKYGSAEVVAVLGVGHPVVFEAVKTSRNLGSYNQHLVGYTEVKSRRYSITYYLGMGGDDWKVGFANYFVPPRGVRFP